VSRLRRGGLAFLTFLLLVAVGVAMAAQLAYYGFLQQQDLVDWAEKAVSERRVSYIASYVVMGIVALLALTSTQKARPHVPSEENGRP